ncbi:MAG: hypothetical protein ACRD3J_08125, partial [Thermoanaerobaculia bacterium]
MITLPRAAFFTNMHFQRATGNPPLVVTAFNQDGSIAGHAQFDDPTSGIGLPFSGNIVRIVIDAPGKGTILDDIEARSIETDATISLTAQHGDKRSPPVIVHGAFGSIATAEVKEDGITGVTIDAGGHAAALVELCYWPAAAGPDIEIDNLPQRRRPSLPPLISEPGPWTMVPNFSYPLRLPINHPLYPASPGAEALAANRAQAAQRIHYGTAADVLPAQPRATGGGTLSLVPGSALAKGSGTAWDESLVGRMLYPAGTDTAFAVMTVPAPDRLVLSRPFTGTTPLQNVAYDISVEDVFAQLHDQLGAILSDAGGMRQAATPPVIEPEVNGRTVVLTNGSDHVSGQGTSWTHDIEGLLLAVGPNPDLYRIVAVSSGQQLTLHAPFAGTSTTAAYRIVSRSPNNRIESEPALSMSPLDLLDLASLSPDYAQVLGLYWNDRSAERNATYDYIILADHDGRFQGDGLVALRWVNGQPDFDHEGVDGAVSTSIAHTGSGALPAPSLMEV